MFFCEKRKKGGFLKRKTLWKPPWNSVPPVRFRAVGRNRRLASFYFCLKSNFEKSHTSQAKRRKTAKNEENPRKSRVFRPASFKTGTLGCYGLKRCLLVRAGKHPDTEHLRIFSSKFQKFFQCGYFEYYHFATFTNSGTASVFSQGKSWELKWP